MLCNGYEKEGEVDSGKKREKRGAMGGPVASYVQARTPRCRGRCGPIVCAWLCEMCMCVCTWGVWEEAAVKSREKEGESKVRRGRGEREAWRRCSDEDAVQWSVYVRREDRVKREQTGGEG